MTFLPFITVVLNTTEMLKDELIESSCIECIVDVLAVMLQGKLQVVFSQFNWEGINELQRILS